jgi:hypothetical protein
LHDDLYNIYIFISQRFEPGEQLQELHHQSLPEILPDIFMMTAAAAQHPHLQHCKKLQIRENENSIFTL